MDFELDEQQRTLRDEARRFLEAEAPLSYARATAESPEPYDPNVNAAMAGLGWHALPFGAAHGGLDMGFISQAILLSEMGRVLLPGPYLASVVLAGTAIELAGSDEQRARLLPGIADGSITATFGLDGHVDAVGGRLRGTRRFVIDGATAELVVVVAHLADGSPGFFVAEPTRRNQVTTIDRTRRVAHLTFEDVEGQQLASSGEATLRHVMDRVAVALSAEMLGAAEKVVETAVEYAGEREQFGRPIGSFQAVKHRAADMKVELESLRNAVYHAAWAIERTSEDASLAASTAKAYASDAFRRIAASGIQVHGGIGFTWEHDAHLFFKRAKFDEAAFGDASFHRERVARMIEARA